LCELYLDLATECVRTDAVARAIEELNESIDVITFGGGATDPQAPVPFWRLLFRLGQLFATTDDRISAIAWAEAALKQAERVNARGGVARIRSFLATQYQHQGQEQKARVMRGQAVEEMRQLGDRRGTAELLLESVRPTGTHRRINPASLKEAEQLASEVGWSEGVSRVRRASHPPPVSE
jgi:hypothetical protein